MSLAPKSEPRFRVRNDLFDGATLHRGRSMPVEAAWTLVRALFFMSSLPWPMALKRFLLRLFGARIGVGFYIRPRVNIHFPWKLTAGDHCWVGDDTGILNLEPVTLGDHVAIAHRVYIATGNHDFNDPRMAYRNQPIRIGSGVWIASCAFIGPGVELGDYCVVGAGSVVTKSVAGNSIIRGNPATVTGQRKLRALSP